jgi:tetraacyldisaccharide 4'-kinase
MMSALSSVYGLVVRARNLAYGRGLLSAHKMPAPVISVGNLTAGGTGKTPLVETLVAHYLPRFTTAMVTRGYKRRTEGFLVVSDGKGSIGSARDCGDEPVQVARKFPGLIVIADERRARGCERAVADHHAKLLVLDDAFQHRSCARDADIVVVDASLNPMVEKMLPAGRLRESWTGLARATAIVLSRCDQSPDPDAVAAFVSRFSDAPVFRTSLQPSVMSTLDGELLEIAALEGKTVVSFCGIGSPASFDATMEILGVKTARRFIFRDHFEYSPESIAQVTGGARELGVDTLFTTEKDAVRLDSFRPLLRDFRVFFPRMRVLFHCGEAGLFSLLDARIKTAAV